MYVIPFRDLIKNKKLPVFWFLLPTLLYPKGCGHVSRCFSPFTVRITLILLGMLFTRSLFVGICVNLAELHLTQALMLRCHRGVQFRLITKVLCGVEEVKVVCRTLGFFHANRNALHGAGLYTGELSC